ncbi:DUF2905 domain-containing protein [uncultured Paludibaculum sp.]|uniref:DUF2905 domain-containing protein n=1 Tax=uncultured Paludibaculum sp. TaxID=1765020 RepID=UPI002AAAF35E|nr:DUF2905 domain-containing protein [uncultured Paludibaculum sp.]
MARALMLIGGLLFAAGLIVYLAGKLHIPIGRLPGDITIRGKHTTFYFPLMTCLLLSLVYSLLVWLLRRK